MNIFFKDIRKHIRKIDWFLVVVVFAATAYGLVLIKSATNYTNSPKQLIVQCAAIFIGIVCAFFMSSLDYDHAVKYVKVYYVLSILALALTLVVGTGAEEVGNNSWIRVDIGSTQIGIQPAEIVKILFITTLAKHLDSVKETINKPLNILFLHMHAGGIIGLVLLQGDLGTALVFMFIFALMCFSAGLNIWYFIGTLFAVVAAAPIIWELLRDDQRKRILFAIYPELDPTGIGYQALKSRTAIGSGGVFGYGFQKGEMVQSSIPSQRVPIQDSDFIFAVAGHEFGIFGTLIVVILLTVILLRIFRISKTAPDDTGSLICMGVFAMFAFQAVENIGMCLGLLPVIGLPLPFFSYGGSSILCSYLGIGLVLSVHSRRNLYYFKQDDELL